VLSDFNLLATSERGFESEACSELWMMLRAVGDERPVVDRSHVRGLILARTNLDPAEAIGRLRDELRRRPLDFRSVLRVLPVERVIKTEVEKIVEAAHELASKIGVDESFRITVEKRRTGLRSREVIEAVAKGIERRVNLKFPDWVVLVEIVSQLTGVSVVKPDSMLNVQKERARLPMDG
jgi:tRNA acetyltransferase TAN1